MGDERTLRARARAAMKAGNLPDHRPERLWGGLGSGESCAVCGKTVDEQDVELELEFTANAGAGATVHHVHARCFAAWEFERRNGGLNDHSLPPADEEGIIPGGERSTTERGKGG